MPKSATSKQSANPGFTIVELLVVIVVIGILAAITIVSYTGISQKAITASLQSDLNNASTQLKMYQVDNGYYPTSIALGGDYCPTPADANAKYCLKASSNNSYTAYSAVNNTNPQTFSLTVINTNGTAYSITNDTVPTLVPPDTTAPTQVTGLAATNGDTQSVLTWNAATDNVGVTGYRIKRATDNTMMTNLTTLTSTVSVTTYTATGLTNGTAYYFTVEAKDAAGNWGTASGVGSATPAAQLGYIASGPTYYSGGEATATLTRPAVVAGDVMIAMLAQIGGATVSAPISPPTGWTAIASVRPGVAVARYSAYYKVAGSSEPSIYNWAVGSETAGCIHTYKGTPLASAGASGANASSGTSTINALVTTGVPALIVMMDMYFWVASGGVTGTPTSPAFALRSSWNNNRFYFAVSDYMYTTTLTSQNIVNSFAPNQPNHCGVAWFGLI